MQLVVSGLLTHFLKKDTTSNKTLLLLHGWGHNSQLWQPVINQIENATVIALDLPSFGNTPALPTLHTPGVTDYANFVLDFIKKSNTKTPLIILGHSFGGQIAAEIAITHPKIISQLIFVSPALIRSPKLSLKSKILKGLKPLNHLLPKAIYQKLVSYISSKDYAASSPIQKKILSKIITEDYSQKLHKITQTTTIIWGSEDKAIPYHGNLLAEKIPNSTLTVMYGAGHNPHLTHIQDLAKIITQAIK